VRIRRNTDRDTESALDDDTIRVYDCLDLLPRDVSYKDRVALLVLVHQRVLAAAAVHGAAEHHRLVLLVVAAALTRRGRIPLGCAITIFPR
jgi:hypothetical protein